MKFCHAYNFKGVKLFLKNIKSKRALDIEQNCMLKFWPPTILTYLHEITIVNGYKNKQKELFVRLINSGKNYKQKA